MQQHSGGRRPYLYRIFADDLWADPRCRQGPQIVVDVRSRRINVYDWDGNFIRRLVLDMPGRADGVVGDRLVAASVNPETAEEIIVSYPLH